MSRRRRPRPAWQLRAAGLVVGAATGFALLLWAWPDGPKEEPSARNAGSPSASSSSPAPTSKSSPAVSATPSSSTSRSETPVSAKPSPSRSGTPTPKPTVAPTKPPAKPTPSSTPTTVSLTTQAQLILNEHRRNLGLPTLARYPGMDGTAQEWAETMAERDTLVHRPTVAPYKAEVIAAGPTTANDVINLWMNSPAHKDIILDPDYTNLGVGYAEGYWIMVFS